MADTESYDPIKNLDHKHAEGVLEMINRLLGPRFYGNILGFKQSVQISDLNLLHLF